MPSYVNGFGGTLAVTSPVPYFEKASRECNTLEYSRGRADIKADITGEEAATQLRMAPLARRVEA